MRDIYDLRRMKDQHILSHSENDNGEEREWIGPRTQQEYQHAASVLFHCFFSLFVDIAMPRSSGSACL